MSCLSRHAMLEFAHGHVGSWLPGFGLLGLVSFSRSLSSRSQVSDDEFGPKRERNQIPE